MDHIYLDHNSTTPTRPEVVEAMARCYAAGYANPASQHQPGQHARRILEESRQRVVEILGGDLNCLKPDRLIFTSGGTEANNLAILGIAQAGRQRYGQVIASSIEHACVLEAAEHLMELGWRLDTLSVDGQGVVQPEALESLLARVPPSSAGSNTVSRDGETKTAGVVSVMLANHETGVLQPIAQLATVCRSAGVPLHTDAVAAAGKIPIDFRGLGVAALSIAAHKFQGPLGIGALIVRHDVAVAPMLFGGHQQEGLRPGTESVALAAGMRTALELWQKEQDEHCRNLTALRDRFEAALKAGRPGVIVHGEGAARLPQTSNIAFPGLEGQILLLALDMAGVACSVGSACASGSTELSPTLRAMGLPNGIVASSLRFSLGATNTEAQIDEAVARILRVCRELGE
jgi:cysteine desulfurase